MSDEGEWEVTGPTGFLHNTTGIGIRRGGGAIPVAVVFGNRDQAEPIARMMAASRDLLAALTSLLAAFTEERQIFVDCSSVSGVVDEESKEVLAKFDAVIQPARDAIDKATQIKP